MPTVSGWRRWVGLAFSAAILVAIIIEMSDGGMSAFGDALPATLGFYLAFVLSYSALPVFDWLIYRRLWGMPFGGITALLKKRVANDVMFGYSGELYLYVWARARRRLTRAPFGAIKDVAILSALAGNAMTLGLLIISWPMIADLSLEIEPRFLLGSGGIVVGSSLVILLIRKKLFTLPRRDLFISFGLHFFRITLSTSFLAVAWYFALPEVPVAYWALFAALRLVISRLPLVPSKDLLFAAAAVFLTDQGDAMGNVVAMSAGLFLATNLIVGLVLTGSDLLGRRTA
ncbi:MAG: hypothetical protein AAGD40_02145 [Pseudomonadota bacterium]